ncbi:MAG: DUF1289 domain-containing protein [Methylophilaceae bacterium]|jgi:predicted Fe-S protein YdhL (DUF1289 family)|uniref:DUF1289 domain-containing protein n=1 Tax=Methylobacillus sp. MM3 TaxID=1848039 RepID=UPI0007DE884F|nr:DUF1289 domain-containing protein [Methylobacillus sp. MM3]OAJ70155.1 hypothetical protein A7976_00445 [Methylobacillus sp. MM3]
MSDPGLSSPCIGVCRMDSEAGVCSGCLRTRDEIAAWSKMPDEQKRQLLQVLERRLAESVSFD